MKKIGILLLMLLVLPTILAVDLDVKKVSSNEVMVLGIDRPATFDLEITNNGPSDYFEFYNLLGFRIFPLEKISIANGETKNITLSIRPLGDLGAVGPYTLTYFIRGQDDSEVEKKLTLKKIELKDAFEISSGGLNPESNSVEILLKNTEKFDFGKTNIKFSSAFFEFEEETNIGPNEQKSFVVELEQEDYKLLTAGFYTMNAEIKVQNQIAEIEGTLKFEEKSIVTEQEKDYGFFIFTKIIKKTNEGNSLAKIETKINKNIISRLFTTFSPDPDNVERHGLTVEYTWNKRINPGESFEVSIKTNYLFPLIVIILIVAVVLLAKQYTKTNLVLRKRVTFVKAKGGEFALKVSVFISAKKYIEKIQVFDKLPPLVKIYERFGGEKPKRINEKLKRLEWDFEKLEAGETRMISYIIYSKVGVLGKFALPETRAIYEKDGKIHETESNKAFFVAEQGIMREE
ncbi:MAG: hypothetical protein KKB31_06795 [Nanoarchaeota archaeon]|nr:hypothetical protein [Nanoarchaeota archaeon]